MPNWIEAITGSLEQKKQYQHQKQRLETLPEPYVSVAKALHRYLTYYGGITDGDTIVTMMSDLADLFERAATDATPVRAIVGDDPVEFAESLARAYTGKQWLDGERAKLVKAIDDAHRRGPR